MTIVVLKRLPDPGLFQGKGEESAAALVVKDGVDGQLSTEEIKERLESVGTLKIDSSTAQEEEKQNAVICRISSFHDAE